MPYQISIHRQRELIKNLASLIVERSTSETSFQNTFAARQEALESQRETDRQAVVVKTEAELKAVRVQHVAEVAVIQREAEAAVQAVAQNHERLIKETQARCTAATENARNERRRGRRQADVTYVATQHALEKQLNKINAEVDERRAILPPLRKEADWMIWRRGCKRTAKRLEPKQGTPVTATPFDRFAEAVAQIRVLQESFDHQRAARFLADGWPFGILMLAWLAAIYPAGSLLGWHTWYWIATSGVCGGVAAIGTYRFVRPIVVRQTVGVYSDILQRLADAETALATALEMSKADADRRLRDAAALRDKDTAAAEAACDEATQAQEAERDNRLQQIVEESSVRRKAATEAAQEKLRATEAKNQARLKEIEQAGAAEFKKIADRFQAELGSARQSFDRSWHRLVTQWNMGVGDFQNEVDAMNAFCERRFPEWNTVAWDKWEPPTDTPAALRIGAFTVKLEMFDRGIPEHPDMQAPRREFPFPAVLSFPACPSLLLESWGEGRHAANRTIQNVMLRFLTAFPPGKVRFTIIDPTGLGQNFSAFMHLADFDERLVASRIWTEPAHIAQRLADLTDHMEKVIQKYLRNEFPSINAYNEQAGEVAEAFQILVVANFPAGFSDEAAARLVSIANSGARCGVYTLISTDSRLDLPRNFDLADLEANSVTLQWNGDGFVWIDEGLREFQLKLDPPASEQIVTQAIKAAGRRAVDAFRVEVPFSTVAAPPDQWWTCDSRNGIEVALGRAGASKLQYLRLGRGTSQHVLIAGKTGSGKSSLLHAMITNLSIFYAPDQVQFYLIDFKKGVEFKPYATHRLPHTRVIAIESEREFGMSVLERLDFELKRRGDLFRTAGVQDVRGYRDANPDAILPRILLVIDEFQEFFVQDDKIAQDASLLLDRLVRQGRAFGIHILLGSQTLAGAYSLARSTLSQMAVRIALQCSEADAHLILSEDNTAARLLNRPGEAIYNDANGLMEGNHPFQVVWLPGQECEEYLARVSARVAAQDNGYEPPIVFEGNVAADPSGNAFLRQALRSRHESVAPTRATLASPQAWLGDAVAIKDPTAATFRRHSGCNLLVVGQEEEMALGLLSNAMIGLAATTAAAKFYLFDGTRPEAPDLDFWPRFSRQVPLDLTYVFPRDTTATMSEIAAEITRRAEHPDDTSPPTFVVVYNLSRFRDLRKSDDDFGFSSMSDDKPESGAKHFLAILRDGPAVGVHLLIWCDNYNNLSRSFDRQTLRDLDLRVLFQMSANDSSNLMDSPLASKLGVHRAIFHSEENGQSEKFRPYGEPNPEWLNWVREQLESQRLGASLG